jgi:hypothetical protein
MLRLRKLKLKILLDVMQEDREIFVRFRSGTRDLLLIQYSQGEFDPLRLLLIGYLEPFSVVVKRPWLETSTYVHLVLL